MDHSSALGRGSAAGGCVVSWMDEPWKTAISVARCWSWIPYGTPHPFPVGCTVSSCCFSCCCKGQPGFDPGQCQYKAHVDCPNKGL
jgi:hypothetical protein